MCGDSVDWKCSKAPMTDICSSHFRLVSLLSSWYSPALLNRNRKAVSTCSVSVHRAPVAAWQKITSRRSCRDVSGVGDSIAESKKCHNVMQGVQESQRWKVMGRKGEMKRAESRGEKRVQGKARVAENVDKLAGRTVTPLIRHVLTLPQCMNFISLAIPWEDITHQTVPYVTEHGSKNESIKCFDTNPQSRTNKGIGLTGYHENTIQLQLFKFD